MLRTTNSPGSSTILQSSIDAANENKVDESGSNETNLSNISALKKSTKAWYLTFRDTKKGGDNPKRGACNTKKGVKAAKGSNYLTPDAKKAFNYLWYAFTQAGIF